MSVPTMSNMDFELSIKAMKDALPDAAFEGSGPDVCTGIASLETAAEGDISFISHKKYAKQLAECRASLIIMPPDFEIR